MKKLISLLIVTFLLFPRPTSAASQNQMIIQESFTKAEVTKIVSNKTLHIAGSSALILAVPLTTLLAAFVALRGTNFHDFLNTPNAPTKTSQPRRK